MNPLPLIPYTPRAIYQVFIYLYINLAKDPIPIEAEGQIYKSFLVTLEPGVTRDMLVQRLWEEYPEAAIIDLQPVSVH